jgi:predicted nucleic acid-binding protein
MYLLDTNVVSAIRRPHRTEKRVLDWLAAHPEWSFFISAITLLELEVGVSLMERRDALQAAPLRRWLEDYVVPGFAGRILAVDARVARCSARLHVPDPCAELDALIAGTAISHDLTLVTRNVKDFHRTGAKVLNPWQL